MGCGALAGVTSRELRAQPHVAARIQELQDEIAKRNAMSADELAQDLEETWTAAMGRPYEVTDPVTGEVTWKTEKPSFAAAANAKHIQAKLCGFMVEKVQVSTENMSDEELVKVLKDEGNSVIPWDKVLKESRGGKV